MHESEIIKCELKITERFVVIYLLLDTISSFRITRLVV